MRCLACDVALNEFEATRKYPGTKNYVDLCNTCHGLSAGYKDYDEEDEENDVVERLDSHFSDL